MLNFFSVLTENNYGQWIRLVCTRPNTAAIFLRSLCLPHDEDCTCRQDGTMFNVGTINDCIKCCEKICTLDSHDHLGTLSSSLLAWISVIFQGKKVIFYLLTVCKKIIKTDRYFKGMK